VTSCPRIALSARAGGLLVTSSRTTSWCPLAAAAISAVACVRERGERASA
jgi:hypothetical protein